MPRKPGRHIQPRLGFSSFARSKSIASANKVKRQFQNSKLQESPSPSSSEDKINQSDSSEDEKFEASNTSKDKIKQSDSSEGEEFEEVQADFAFFDPKPKDFHGVKVLLQTYLDESEWDLSGFVDLVLEQTTVGTVVKIEDDEDEIVYAVISALNLDRYKDQKCIKELKDFLINSCMEKNVLSNLKSMFENQAKSVGLLISRRVVNLPPQLLPPLYEGLFEEVSWATEDEPTKELRSSFCFKHYLVVTKIYVLKEHSNSKKRKKSSNRKSNPSKSGNEAVIYVKPEDELLYELSSWSFKFPVQNQPVSTNSEELKNYNLMGLVMAVEACKMSKFQEQLKSYIE